MDLYIWSTLYGKCTKWPVTPLAINHELDALCGSRVTRASPGAPTTRRVLRSLPASSDTALWLLVME